MDSKAYIAIAKRESHLGDNDPTTPPLGMTIEELLPNSFGPENLS